MPFQCVDERWQERDQALGADPIGLLPDLHQSLLHVWAIAAWLWHWWLPLLRMIQEPHRIFTMIPGDLSKGFQHFSFPFGRRALILWSELLQHIASGLQP